ncbi:MAG TPA: NusG domain II-containing protein [Bacillota bacterium]|nr:NusG domain II-containing protein [Bacillota bacterium]
MAFRLTRGDGVLLVVLSAVALGAWLGIALRPVPVGAEVVITVGDQAPRAFRLDEDRWIELEGPRGPAVVEIRDGRVRIASSDCPDAGWHAHWLARPGSLICVPNRLIVKLAAGEGTGADTDAITR